jgi:CRP-like cAMP-binding protein
MDKKLPRTHSTGSPVKNIILSEIPDEEFSQLAPHLTYVELKAGQKLHTPSEGIEFSYFPNSGLVSLLVETKNGKSVEVGISGYEGLTGVALLAGLTRTTHLAVIQVAGDGFRIKANVLRQLLTSTPQLLTKANRFAAVQGMQFAQTAACNRLHDVTPRMARWLLMTDDRVNAFTLKVTHDFLSMMLGTDRPSVSAAAKAMQGRRVIDYKHGTLQILDRKKLEQLVCECYPALRQFNHQLGLEGRSLSRRPAMVPIPN